MEDRNLRMFGDEEGDKEGGEGHPLAITIVNVAYPSGQPASQPTLSGFIGKTGKDKVGWLAGWPLG